jgi:hypothetical protein
MRSSRQKAMRRVSSVVARSSRKVVGQRLQRPGAGGLDLDPHRPFGLRDQLGCSGAADWERRQIRATDVGGVEGGQTLRTAIAPDQLVDSLMPRHRGKAPDLGQRAAKSGAFQKMGRTVEIPAGRVDCGQNSGFR